MLDLAALPLALGDPQAALRNVSLKGDADFAQALAFVLQNLRPEPEEELSRFVGDAAAQRIVGLLRAERIALARAGRAHARFERALSRHRKSDARRARRGRRIQRRRRDACATTSRDWRSASSCASARSALAFTWAA